MDAKNVFKKYYARVMREGWIKAILFGLAAGAVAMFVSSFIIWFFFAKCFWVSFIVWAFVSALVIPFMYFKKYKPTTKAIARRIDELGLEERIITMTELEGDESFIAMKQREDALNAMNLVNADLLKIAVSLTLIITLSVTTVLGVGMTTVSALAEFNVVEPGKEIIVDNTPVLYTIAYIVDEGGYVDSSVVQIVEAGKDAEGVLAVAEDGWAFQGWSDGSTNPYRQETSVNSNMTFFAIFVEVEPGDGEGDGEGEPGEGEEADQGQPPQEGGEGQQSQGEAGDGNGDGAGGQSKPNNQIIDGNTYYGDIYSTESSSGLSDASSNNSMSQSEKSGIADYYNGIATGSSKGED